MNKDSGSCPKQMLSTRGGTGVGVSVGVGMAVVWGEAVDWDGGPEEGEVQAVSAKIRIKSETRRFASFSVWLCIWGYYIRKLWYEEKSIKSVQMMSPRRLSGNAAVRCEAKLGC